MMDWPACLLRVSIRWMMEPVMTPAFDYAVARENNVGYTYALPQSETPVSCPAFDRPACSKAAALHH
jgi:hypothetical protein